MTPAFSIRRFVKRFLPEAVLDPIQGWRSRARVNPYEGKAPEAVFGEIYEGNHWRGAESVSGPGSDLAQTVSVRRELPGLLRELRVKSMLDVPCGDFHWMRHVDLGACAYSGADIVPALIERNRRLYGAPRRSFLVLNMTTDPLPRADLILCRDCFIHLTNHDVLRAVDNFKRSGATYLLATLHPLKRNNHDGVTGGIRLINLCAPPFAFGEPLRVIREDGFPGLEDDPNFVRVLGLWRLADLPHVANGTN